LGEKYSWLLGEALAAEVTAAGWTTTNGRLMGRAAGHVLRPHLDSAHFGVTCLLYFSDAATLDDGALGLYRLSRRPEVLDASTYYPDKSEGIESSLVTAMSCVRISSWPSSVVRSPCTGSAAVTATGWRFVYQCTWCRSSST
jgi:hypothetical protein